MEKTNAIIFFTDIRGFTKWSEGIEAFQYIEDFIDEFYKIIDNSFPNTYIKKLGDGAMIVKEINTVVTIESLSAMLKENLKQIKNADKKFNKLCTEFFELHGYQTELHLGWGVVRGVVKKIPGDYIGGNINKCARLCGIARPFGIIIEKDDFPKLPSRLPYNFIKQIRKLDGIAGDVNVWVTEEIATQFIPREKIREAPEVHIAGTCIKKDNGKLMVLIAKRNSDRKLFPRLYEGCGGQLAYSESFIEGVKRHFGLEMHIDVEVLKDIHKFYEIKEPNEAKIPGINFLCIYKGGTPESKNHSEIKWVSEEEFKTIPPEKFIPYLKEDILKFIDMFKKEEKKKERSIGRSGK